MTEKPKEKEKETPPTRLRTLLEGAAMLVGAIVIGIALLAMIGLVPGHQDSKVLEPILWIVSLAMYAGILWGIWLIIKAALGLR